jgi:Arc/MetJ-type ribon-helix-helix transcriptional regulator
MENKLNLSLSKELRNKLEEKAKQTSFESIQEYITFVLEQVVSESSENDKTQAYTKEEEAYIEGRAPGDEEEELLSAMEEEKLKKGLADLGYKV